MATEKLCKDKNGVITCNKKNLPWFVFGYDFHQQLVRFLKRRNNLLDMLYMYPIKSTGDPIYIYVNIK